MSSETVNPASWEHMETDSLATFPDALAAASKKNWPNLDPETSSRYLRAIALMTLQAGRISTAPPPVDISGYPAYGYFAGSDYDTKEALWVGSTVLRTLPVLVLAQKQTNLQVQSVRTTDGKPATLVFENEAGVPIPWGAICLAVCGVSIAAAVIAHYTADVVDRELARKTDSRNLLAAQADAIGLIQAHAAMEKQAQKSLPWSNEEKAVLDSLLKTQKEISTRKEIPLPQPFTGAIESLGTAASQTISSAGGAGAQVIDSGSKGAAKVADSLSTPLILGGAALGAYALFGR